MTSRAVWDKIEDHHALQATPGFAAVRTAFAALAADPSTATVVHVPFAPAARIPAVLHAPVTSFARVVRCGSADALAGAMRAVTALPAGVGGHGGVWGRTVERGECVMMFGWDAKEVGAVVVCGSAWLSVGRTMWRFRRPSRRARTRRRSRRRLLRRFRRGWRGMSSSRHSRDTKLET